MTPEKTFSQKLLDCSPDVICALSAQGLFLQVSAAAKKMWGYEPGELAGKPFIDFVRQEDRSATLCLQQQLKTDGTTCHLEHFFLHKDGFPVFLSWSWAWESGEGVFYGVARAPGKTAAPKLPGKPGRDWQLQKQGGVLRKEAGSFSRRAGALQGTTGRQEAGQPPERCELRFRSLVQSGKDIIALLDRDFRIAYISPNCLGLTGSPPHQLEGRSAFEGVHPEDRETVMEEAAKAFGQKEVELSLYRYPAAGGEYRWCEATLANRLDDPNIGALVLNCRDVTARKKILDEVHMLSTVVENSPNSVVIADAEGRITWVNEAFCKRTGYSFREALGRNPIELLHGKESCQQTTAYIRQQAGKGVPFRCEVVNYSKSGRKHWIELLSQPILDAQGRMQGHFSIQTDISERKAYEQALQLSEQRYRMLFYQSPTPKWIFHGQTLQFVEVNEAAIRLYGYSREEFLEMTLRDIRPQEDLARFDQLWQGVRQLEGNFHWGVVRHCKKGGALLQADITTYAIELPTGLHFIVTAYDMTEKLLLQQQLLDEKVTAQKEVTKAIIATQEEERSEIGRELHDNVNQILTSARLCVENSRYFPQQRDGFTFKALDLLKRAVSEIRALSRRLVPPSLQYVSLTVALRELTDQYRSLNRFAVEEHFAFAEKVLEEELKITLYRIVQEQLNNVVKYAGASRVQLRLVRQGPQLSLVIEDNGEGFDAAAAGPGLGFRNIKNRAELFQGRLSITSSPGKGCRVEVVFPERPAEQRAAPPARP
jgi:PAS domain S-box-containing protein